MSFYSLKFSKINFAALIIIHIGALASSINASLYTVVKIILILLILISFFAKLYFQLFSCHKKITAIKPLKGPRWLLKCHNYPTQIAYLHHISLITSLIVILHFYLPEQQKRKSLALWIDTVGTVKHKKLRRHLLWNQHDQLSSS